MFKTDNMIKALGALFGAALFLVVLLAVAGNLLDDSIRPAADGTVAQAYTIDIPEPAAAAPEVAATEPAPTPAAEAAAAEATPDAAAAPVAVAAGAGDAAAGEKVFGKCRACHKLDGKDGVGPHLNGVVGRAVASVDGFKYSDPMKAHAAEAPVWDSAALHVYLADPKGAVPGNRMAFAGLKDPKEIDDLVAYLETVK